MPEIERECWVELLCRYYQLSTSFALRRLDKKQTLLYAKRSIEVAQELENRQLIASTYYRRVRVHLDLRKAAASDTEKQRRLAHARLDTQAVLRYVDDACLTLKGNIYLIAAEVYSLDACEPSTRKQCEKWQDQAAAIVYRNVDEEDETFLRLNATALHHEKAKR
jgi:hypothetical protein